MKKHFAYILTLTTLLLSACTNNDEATLTADRNYSLEVPIVWSPADGITTDEGVQNRLGDPGIKAECPEPTCLYLFTLVCTNRTSDQYEYIFYRRENLEKTDWELENEGLVNERYRLTQAIELNISSPVLTSYADNDVIGFTRAIASARKLSTEQLKGIAGSSYAGIIDNPEIPIAFSGETAAEAIRTQLKNATIDLSADACDGGLPFSQTNYRDLYSSPENLDKNGSIVYDESSFPTTKIGHLPVNLYHAAAKIDFQWEVAPAMQSKVAIESISVTNLPTLCRIFCPARNPATSGSSGSNPTLTYTIDALNSEGITITPGNKWIGRQCFFHLQPADGSIVYEVDFEDVNTTDGFVLPSYSGAFTPPSVNAIYTGWYRIPAMVKTAP